MALTIARVTGADYVQGNKKVKVRTITFDSSYLDDGESLTAADVGLRKIEQVIPNGMFKDSGNDNGIGVAYDFANSKLMAVWGNAGTASVLPEVTSTTDISGYSGRVTFIGY